jgi:hypothetical protein
MKFLSLIISSLMLSTFSLSSLSAFAAAPESVTDRVAHFLESNVMDRTQSVKTEGTITTEGADYLVKFEAKITWSGLKKTAQGLIFEERRDILQSNTKIDSEGNATGEPTRSDRVVVRQYAVTERQTTHSLVGLTTVLQNSIEDVTSLGFTTMIEISSDDKELYIYESQAGFSEVSLDGINIQPVSTASSATLSVNKDGKLVTDETLKFYKVDINRDFAREEINRFNLTATELKN